MKTFEELFQYCLENNVGTRGCFKGCKRPKRNPDYSSPSGSKYWYGEDSKGKYMIRRSDHWSYINGYAIYPFECGSIKKSFWGLKTSKPTYCGKIYLNKIKINK